MENEPSSSREPRQGTPMKGDRRKQTTPKKLNTRGSGSWNPYPDMERPGRARERRTAPVQCDLTWDGKQGDKEEGE